MQPMHSISDLLGPQGPIADHLAGFAPRREQQHLADAVFTTLENSAVLVGEAGTGTGKTFAYLVPALVSGQRIIISTGTRHLQDQLFQNDLPLVRRALGRAVDTALLKGRANYLCRHRLARARHHPALTDPVSRSHLQRIELWARLTESGDIAEVLDVPEDSPVWSHVVSNDEYCSQHEFEDLADCFVHQARKRAQEADIVVVNHHLLCADLALKEEGFGELLPSANGFVIDEAHQLPDIAAQFFGRRLSSRQLLDLARDTVSEQLHEAPDMKSLRERAASLETMVSHARLAFALEPSKAAWLTVRNTAAIEREFDKLEQVLGGLAETLASVAERGKGLESCHRRAMLHWQNLRRFLGQESAGAAASSSRDASDPPESDQPDERDEPGSDYIHWFETWRTGFSLNMTPMTVARPFQRAMRAMPAGWVFTSATLAVGGDFSHFKSQLGIEKANELLLDSPFDYAHHAMLFLPEGLPEPAHASYTRSVMEATLPVLQASAGRAFLLFTSYRALNEAKAWLVDRIDHPVLVQGQSPKRELLEAFQSMGNAVLLGTSSFWEGVDVRGEALSFVMIDKLPFGSPGDPVMSARIDHLRGAGGNPFFEYQLPQAAITLKQGVGRLIRDVTDTGVLMLCDPRIRTRHYGEVFINSLPPMPITRELAEVDDFFRREREQYRDELAEAEAEPESGSEPEPEAGRVAGSEPNVTGRESGAA